jgi:hypothetical protein
VITRLFESVIASGQRLAMIIALSFLFAMPAVAVDEDLLSRASALLENEKNNDAYRLLESEGRRYAGEPDYDYLFGLAALRAGKPGQAVFALERVVQIEPAHAAARMELVAAYMQLGLDQQAQQQLAILETQSPPAAAREAMSRYQDILRPRLSGTPDAVRLVGLSAGYDSNVGSYPDMGLDLGGLLLTVEPIESAYTLLRGTWWEPLRLDDDRRLDFSLHGQLRNYQDSEAGQFDLGLLHAGVLLNATVNAANSYGLGLQANKLWLDSEAFREHIGARAFLERRLDADLSGQLGLKLFSFRFDPKRHDYDLYGINGDLEKRWSPKLRTTLLAAIDFEQASENRFGGDALRLQLGGKIDYRFDQRNQADAKLNWSNTDYRDDYAANTLYNPGGSDKKRTDNSLELALRWRHLLAREWQLDTELSYRKQDSSVRFYEIDRWSAQLTVLRYF